MFNSRIAFAMVSLLVLSGCSATGPLYDGKVEVREGKAEIVVYRPDTFAHGGKSYYVHLDGQEVATLKNGGYVVLETTPEKHTVEIKASALDLFFRTRTAEVLLQGRERKYLRLRPAIAGAFISPNLAVVPVSLGFTNVQESQALTELQSLRQSIGQ